MRYDHTGFVKAGDGTRLFYGVCGPAGLSVGAARVDAVVLSDGIGCDGFAWAYLLPALSRSYRVVHWHYRGHGRSGAPADASRITVEHLAADLDCVLHHLGVRAAVLLGHSMGTQVILEHYRLRPEVTRALVLLCGSYGRITSTFHGTDVLARVLPGLLDVVRDNYAVARAIWGRLPVRLAFHAARLSGEIDGLAAKADDMRRYFEHLSDLDPALFLEMLRLAGEHSSEDLLPRIAVPTLVIAGERDRFTPAPIAAEMAGAIPGAEHFLVQRGTHAAPVEQPAAIVDRIEQFMRARLAA